MKTSDRHREQNARNRQRYLAAGLCRCGRPKFMTRKQCRPCLFTDAEKRARRKKDGLNGKE